MLNYFIETTQNLIPIVIVMGVFFAAMNRTYGNLFKRLWLSGCLAGLGGAAVMAVLKNSTSLIHTGNWNVRTFTVSLAAIGVLGFFMLPFMRKKLKKLTGIVACIAAATIAATLIFYALPDVMSAPFTFSQNGATVLSTDYLFRFLGWIAGLALAWVTYIAMRKTTDKVFKNPAVAILVIILCVNAATQIAKMIQILVTRRVIKGDAYFSIAIFTSNHSDIFIYILMGVALIIPLTLIARSFRIREPYDNPAQKRKIFSSWIFARRWAITLLVCFGLTVSCMTWLKAINEREVELSPVEESQVEGENVYVSLTQVEDGHLHRFAYTTPKGKNVRFIIIKKPNSSSYGVGLDACDICGETGYFERNGQIVCKLCDVVMNVNTIGFKGGCNPIVIDYSVKDGNIVIPVGTLIEHEDIFK